MERHEGTFMNIIEKEGGGRKGEGGKGEDSANLENVCAM